MKMETEKQIEWWDRDTAVEKTFTFSGKIEWESMGRLEEERSFMMEDG